jgi:hypothetical protein
MPLVLAENEATESGISYEDRTGISYQYPGRYRRTLQPGERFIYYRGRRTKDGRRMPQVYFGSGVVGATIRDANQPNRFTCEVLDYYAFRAPVPFKNARDEYLETGANRRGYFQPGVRVISDENFRRILEAAQMSAIAAEAFPAAPERTTAAGYASPAAMRAVEDFAVCVALDEVRRRYPNATVEPQPRNNPGFDILVRSESSVERMYVEVKGTTRPCPQFFMTEGELQFSRRHADEYRLIIVYGIHLGPDTYDLLWHEGPISIESGFRLNPVQWTCEVVGRAASRPVGASGSP